MEKGKRIEEKKWNDNSARRRRSRHGKLGGLKAER